MACGHRVIVADRDAEALQSLVEEVGSRACALALDVTDATRVDRLLDLIPDDFKPIDILVNNAGHDIGGRQRFHLGAPNDWANIIETNLTGLMRVTRSILPEMVRRNTGHIINMSSSNALRPVADMGPYSASKAGVHMLSEVIREELSDTNIKLTEINPGLTKTGIILARFRGDHGKEEQYFDQFRTVLAPDDVAAAVLFALHQPPHVQVAQIVILPLGGS